MKVIHLTNYYLPRTVGGIETYIHNLSLFLRKAGIESIVAVPALEAERPFEFEGQTVVPFPEPGRQDGWFQHHKPTIVHLHSTIPPLSPDALLNAKRHGARTILTLHEPRSFCVRNTVMAFGKTECDGRIDLNRCTACALSQHPITAKIASIMPIGISDLIYRTPKIGTLRKFATKGLVVQRSALFQKFVESADRVVAISGWLQKTLDLNGVPRSKIAAIYNAAVSPSLTQVPKDSLKPFRVGFVGRANSLKGIELLFLAVAALPATVELELIAHAAADHHSLWYYKQLEALASKDPRIKLMDSLSHRAALDFMSSVDVMAVPSQWKECAPLVVLESLAVGTPVLGSNLGAIREQIRDGLDGLLLPHDQVRVWTNALMVLANDPSTLARLKATLRRPTRSMGTVSAEVLDVYREMIDGPVAA